MRRSRIRSAWRERVVVAGAAEHAGEHSGFGDGELADVLAEVSFGSLAEAANGEAAATPEVNLIAVELEDLLLGELLLQLQSDHELGGFALPVACLGQPHITRQLLADGGGALGIAALFKIHINGAHDADRIEAGVLKEPPVFRRKDGVSKDGGNFAIAHIAPLFAVAVVKVGDEARLQVVLAALGVVA